MFGITALHLALAKDVDGHKSAVVSSIRSYMVMLFVDHTCKRRRRLSNLVAETRSLHAAQLAELQLLVAAGLSAEEDAARAAQEATPIREHLQHDVEQDWLQGASTATGTSDPFTDLAPAPEQAAAAAPRHHHRASTPYSTLPLRRPGAELDPGWLTAQDFQCLHRHGGRPVAEALEEDGDGDGNGSHHEPGPYAHPGSTDAAGSSGRAAARAALGAAAEEAAEVLPSLQRLSALSHSSAATLRSISNCLTVVPSGNNDDAFSGLIPVVRAPHVGADEAGVSREPSMDGAPARLRQRTSTAGETLLLLGLDSILGKMKRWAGWQGG